MCIYVQLVNFYVDEMLRSRKKERYTHTHTHTHLQHETHTRTHVLKQEPRERRELAIVQIVNIVLTEYYQLMSFELIIIDLILIFSDIEFVV